MNAYEEQRKKEWDDLEVTRDEFNSITECMKKPEFRKLLQEYADEVNDPENRKIYEAEITQLERERGVDVTFVHPQPGYVIKTSLDGRLKCFLNIGKNELVGKPTSRPGVQDDSTPGLNWSIPYILTPPREDLDKRNNRCRVFDVVFHPDTLYLAEKNPRFRNMVNDTAMDGVENNFKVKLDRKNIKFPKMNFKGISQATVIRKPCEKPSDGEKLDMDPEMYDKLMSGYDELRERRTKFMEEKPVKSPPTTLYYNSRAQETEDKNSKYTTPKFTVKHQTSLNMENFLESKEAKLFAATPNNLVVVINLPLLKSAADATLDVQERCITLKSEKPAKYLLELPLSYKVNPDEGNAKFDSKLKQLTITLPVIREMSFPIDTKEDSGVESDHGSPLPESEIISVESEMINNEIGSTICELSENDEVQSDCADTALRTSENENEIPFMNPHLKYFLPTFTCNLYDKVLAITIHVKNVDSESIHYRILEQNSGLHILFTSIGAGFFPAYHSLCLQVEKDMVTTDAVTVEPWDNNIVLFVKIKNPETLTHYFAGLDPDNMERKDFSITASIKNKLQALEEAPELEVNKNVEVIKNNEQVIVNVRSESIDSDDEEDHENEPPPQEERKRNFTQSRSVSESSGDELPSSIGSSNGSVRYKSILKFSRSVSESSIDDGSAAFSSVTSNDLVNEFHSESEGSSLKKTVRFNDVVSRQLYRSNSSILGQRKKNQRKLKNKRRARDRRMSESENSETDEREKYKIDSKPECDASSIRPFIVRPIIHQSNKSTVQKTSNMDIEFLARLMGNKRKQKRNPRNKEESDDGGKDDGKIETENNSDGDEAWKSSEFKNDLLFHLDI